MSTGRPLVSAVVPTRNRLSLLRRTLRSILGQRDCDLEVVVVDDGSDDGAGVEAAAGDARVRVLRSPVARGVSAARNEGIAAARGRWVAFCDDDDLWAPDKLARQLAAAERAGAEWVYAGDVNVDDALRVLCGAPPPDPAQVMETLPHWNPLASGGSNVMVLASRLAAAGGFDPSLRRTEDWDLWIRLGRMGAPACAPAPLVAYRFHRGNIAPDAREMVDEARRIAERHGGAVDMAAMHRRAAWNALRAGRRLQAVRHYAGAVALGDARSAARAAVALVHPAVGTDRLFSLLPRDEHWAREAERWLHDFAAADADQTAARSAS